MRKLPLRALELLCWVLLGWWAVATDSAWGQENATVTLNAKPMNFSSSKVFYREMGLARPQTESGTILSSKNSVRPRREERSSFAEAYGFFPGDVSNPMDQPTIFRTQHHPIYVNNDPSHWGDVGGFLKDYGRSEFIHVLDQYVGTWANHRYTLGTSFQATDYPVPANHTFLMSDILALVHEAAMRLGHGYGHLYHVFLPEGVDMCLPPPNANSLPHCYSPDNQEAFFFCAFHGSVTFGDSVGHVIFTVEPYQDVIGCSVPPIGTPNGQLIDSTNNVLSHEVSEAITDPDLNAWWVQDFTYDHGGEIADLCARFARFSDGNNYWQYGQVDLNGHDYLIQPLYSNKIHGCVYGHERSSDN